MKSRKLTVMILLLFIIAVFAVSSVVSLAFSFDLVGKVAVTSFEALTKALPGKVGFDKGKDVWVINGLDGQEKIVFSPDFKSHHPDIAVAFNAEPFIQAGLDVTKLPAGQYQYDKATGWMTMPYEYGKDQFGADARKSIVNTFKAIVKNHRDLIGYHEKLDHYGIALGDGNMFEWAKDMSTNDKDMVFVLNPKPLIDAGVDKAKIKEWVFAKVPVKDKDGRPLIVDKFLKPFNVK